MAFSIKFADVNPKKGIKDKKLELLKLPYKESKTTNFVTNRSLMKKIGLGLLLLVFGFGCGDEEGNQIPPNVLKRDQMTTILTDIAIAEGKLNNLSYPDTAKDSTMMYARTYYQKILDNHDVDQAKFKRSFRFYIRNPHIMQLMYDPVIENLQKKEGQSQTKQVRE